MAPSSSEPRQIVVVLNPARRKALYQLVSQITAYMRSQLEFQHHGDTNAEQSSLPAHSAAQTAQSSADCAVSQASTATASPTPAKVKQDASVSQRRTQPSPGLITLREAGLADFDGWRKDFLAQLKQIVSVNDDTKILEERQKRQEKLARMKIDTPAEAEDLIDLDGEAAANSSAEDNTTNAVRSLQAIYPPIPTRLTTVPPGDRKEVLSAVLILLLSTGNYSAYSRTFITYLTSAFGLPLSLLMEEEKEIANTMLEASAEAERAKKDGTMSADAEAQKRKHQNQASRFWKVGLASVAGAAIIGVTGGLAAPVVAGAIGGLMGSVGLGSLASFLGIFWMNGALVGTLFGAFGARMTGEIVDKYAKEVDDFRFLPLNAELGSEFRKDDKDIRRLRVAIGINGWLMSEDEVTKPWRCLGDESEVFALRYEMDSLLKLGHALEHMVESYAWGVLKIEILKRTVLATLWAALWPIQLLKVASGIDNPFNLAKNRSEKAGRILADALINRVQGKRPVTLIGYSLGARVIYFCLQTLAERRAFGLVDSVVFIGAPAPSNRNHWQMMRSVVAGKMFNVYSENDYILAFLYRATSIQLGIAGLQGVEDIDGVENLNLSEEVQGHLRYPDLVPQILTRCGFPNVKGGKSPIEKDDIKLEEADVSIKEGTLIELAPVPEPPVMPVTVRSMRKSHRQIFFPNGIMVNEERPLVKKVKSVPISDGFRSEARQDFNTSLPVPEGLVKSPESNPLFQNNGEPSELPDFSSASEAPLEGEGGQDEGCGGGINMLDDGDYDDDADMVTYMETLRLEDKEGK